MNKNDMFVFKQETMGFTWNGTKVLVSRIVPMHFSSSNLFLKSQKINYKKIEKEMLEILKRRIEEEIFKRSDNNFF